MFKILVPTDFSENAGNALNYAIEIANRAGAYILLYHTYVVPSTTGSFTSVERFVKSDVETDMKKLIAETIPKLKSKAVLDGKTANGLTIPLVCNKAKEENYDLIIMGTQGASGLKEIFVGTNAAGIMNKTQVPVLAIPSVAKFTPLKEIVLAMDEHPINNTSMIDSLNRLRKIFKSKLTIYHLETSYKDKGIHPTVSNHFKDSTFTTVKYEINRNLHQMIQDFTNAQKTDLLCMIRRKRSFLHEIFNPSVTRKEVFNSEIPILVLHD